MNAIGPHRPLPPPEGASLSAGPRERTLTEMLSLTDAWRFVPETLGLLAAIRLAQAWLAQAWLADAPATAAGMPHPFWIPVLLMSGQYGMMGGLFAALAATGAFLLGGLPPQSAAQDFYEHAAIVAAQPCAWFGTALVLGGLRTLHMHHHADLQERFARTGAIAEALAGGLERATAEIDLLERRIATDYATLSAVLHGLSRLRPGDPAALAGSLAELLRFGAGVTGFAVHLNTPHGLRPCAAFEDGVALDPAAIAPPPAGGPAAQGGEDAAAPPFAVPVRAADGALLAVLVCTRLHPAQDPAAARRRLEEIGRVLAVLLAARPALAAEAA